MNADSIPLAQITSIAMRLLYRELGPVNAVRFLNQFSLGNGNYTEERYSLTGNATVDELVAEIYQMRKRRDGTKRSQRKSS